MDSLQEHADIQQEKFAHAGLLGNILLKQYFKNLKKLISGWPYKNILDIGCGEGIPLMVLKPALRNARLAGIDTDDGRLEIIKKNIPEGDFQKDSVYELKGEKTFDLVLCLEVLEHLEHPEQALKGISRAAGGDIIISVPNEPIWSICNLLRLKYLNRLGNTPSHIQKWSIRSFTRLIEQYFTMESISGSFPWIIAKCRAEAD